MLSEPERTQLPLRYMNDVSPSLFFNVLFSSVADHSVILRCLDAENIATLLCLLLLEQKLVIHSTRSALLTSFAEAMSSVRLSKKNIFYKLSQRSPSNEAPLSVQVELSLHSAVSFGFV